LDLEIYGNASGNLDLKSLAEKLNVSNNVVFHKPVQDIEHKYVEASFYLMTSRLKVWNGVDRGHGIWIALCCL
jgi:glycosyltransferase involved in cell wall biosynthesis